MIYACISRSGEQMDQRTFGTPAGLWLHYPQRDVSENQNTNGIVGNSSGIQKVLDFIQKAATSDAPVLISGETGTGKELVARAIHNIGPHARNPFIPVDCSTLTLSLIESELFGHVRGAFTGATYTTRGLLEAASGGTAFLDEISDLPLKFQSKLLRALQEKKVRPVGGISSLDFNARIIAATNQNLEAAICEGSFRRDLYYRLKVLTVELPPLRERREDIGLLAEHFLQTLCEEQADKHFELSMEAFECLVAYDWPGNIRELENCIRRIVALCPASIIRAEDLPPEIRYRPEEGSSSMICNCSSVSLQEIERAAIARALSDTNGNKIMASRMLGIGKTTLYRKIKEYGIGCRSSAPSWCPL